MYVCKFIKKYIPNIYNINKYIMYVCISLRWCQIMRCMKCLGIFLLYKGNGNVLTYLNESLILYVYLNI